MVGTSEELKEYNGRVRDTSDGIEAIDFKGIFAPASELNFAFF